MDSKDHPYVEFEQTELWRRLEKAIQQLSDNNDIKLQTDQRYIIGYLAKSLSEQSGKTKTG
jgi:hypothetical protein